MKKASHKRLHTLTFVPFKKWKNYSDKSENAWGLGGGGLQRGMWTFWGWWKSSVLMVPVYLCPAYQTVSLNRVNFIVYNLYFNKHDFKNICINLSKPTIFQMGTSGPADVLQQLWVGNTAFSAPLLRQKLADTLASCPSPQHIPCGTGTLILSSQCSAVGGS